MGCLTRRDSYTTAQLTRRWRRVAFAIASTLVVFMLASQATGQNLQFYPSETEFGTLFFDDKWPVRGDHDFNDLVVRYRFATTLGSNGAINAIAVKIHPVALGGLVDLGLALRLPLPAGTPHTATLSEEDGPGPVLLSPVANENDLIWTVLDNVRTAFPGGVPGEAINTDPWKPWLASREYEISVTFNPPVEGNGWSTPEPPFDLFIFHAGSFSHQVHLPAHTGTGRADHSLFNTQDDCSNSFCSPPGGSFVDNTGRWYVDDQEQPWAFGLPSSARWATEGTPIETAFPGVSAWLASSASVPSEFPPNDPEFVYFLPPASVPALPLGAVPILLGTLIGLGVRRAVRRREYT